MNRKVKPGTAIGYTEPNLLVDTPNNYRLVLKGNTSRTLDDIIAIFLQQSNINLTHEQVRESFINVMATAHDEVLRGNPVSLKYLSIRNVVSGIFNDPTETFDPNKHKLRVIYVSSEEIREAARKTSVRNMGRAVNNEIGNITNRTTNDINQNVTPGGAISILGNRIKVTGNNEGRFGRVFFLDDSTDTVAASVKEEDLLLNTPSQLIFIAPTSLTSGERYRIRISTFAGINNKPVKNQRLLDSGTILTCL